MDIEAMTTAVAKWASTQPLIRKAYLFGSKVRGTHKPDSDLDVAVDRCGQLRRARCEGLALWRDRQGLDRD